MAAGIISLLRRVDLAGASAASYVLCDVGQYALKCKPCFCPCCWRLLLLELLLLRPKLMAMQLFLVCYVCRYELFAGFCAADETCSHGATVLANPLTPQLQLSHLSHAVYRSRPTRFPLPRIVRIVATVRRISLLLGYHGCDGGSQFPNSANSQELPAAIRHPSLHDLRIFRLP